MLRSNRSWPVGYAILAALAVTASALLGFAHGLEATCERGVERALRISRGEPLSELEAAGWPQEVPLALRSALGAGRYEGVLELSAASGSPGDWPVFRAAALLELGRGESSLETWSQPLSAHLSGLEVRLAQAQDLYERGVESLVVDRYGRYLGSLSRADGFRPAPGIEPEIVPPAIVESFELRGGHRLTLDLRLSRLALEALGRNRGSIVLVDPATGEVLAAVSDRRTFEEDPSAAVRQLREPASIAKLITVAAALRSGIDVDAAIRSMRCNGSLELDGELLYCSSIGGRFWGGLDQALATSCNVAFAQLGVEVGAEALIAEYRRWGFLPEAAQGGGDFGQLLDETLTERQLGDLAIGLNEANITPVHAALMAAAFYRGYFHEPVWLKSTDGLLGVSPGKPVSGTSRRVLESEWLPQLQKAMLAVAERGTVARVAPDRFPVAMKTGTGRNEGYYFHVNYIGLGPLPEPELAWNIRLSRGGTSRRVRRAAYQVTKRLLESLADRQERERRPSVPPSRVARASWPGPAALITADRAELAE